MSDRPDVGESAPDNHPDRHPPLAPLVGNLWVPVWAIRPGTYSAIAALARAMPLWLEMHSFNSDYFKPIYASRETLGETLGISRATVSRQLKALQKAHLLFVVERGIERKSGRHRPPARWALDPFAADIWRPEFDKVLARIAEDDGHDGRWFHNAITSLTAFERRSRLLRARIEDEMPFVPKRRKRRRSKKRKAATQIASSAQNEPRGEVFARGGRTEPQSNDGGPIRRRESRKKTRA